MSNHSNVKTSKHSIFTQHTLNSFDKLHNIIHNKPSKLSKLNLIRRNHLLNLNERLLNIINNHNDDDGYTADSEEEEELNHSNYEDIEDELDYPTDDENESDDDDEPPSYEQSQSQQRFYVPYALPISDSDDDDNDNIPYATYSSVQDAIRINGYY